MNKKTLIVTGGNGYIGSHMCKLLFNKGYDVHIIDNFSTSPQEPTHSYGTFHQADIGDKVTILSLLKKLAPEAIFHFAARALVSESEENPLLYFEENLQKTISLLDCAVKAKVPHFIFSSTCATFGIPTSETINEVNLQNPINTYGLTKLLMEKVMKDLALKKLINVIIFRYFNAAGCSPESEIGENHDPETHLIPSLVKSYLSGGKIPFTLFGDNFATADGSCVRDYIHVEDLATAHYAGLEYLRKNSGLHDFNLGSEIGSSNLEVITAFEKVTGEKLKVKVAPPRPGDPPMLVADSSKAKDLLQFFPSFNLEDSIRHTLNYFKNKVKK